MESVIELVCLVGVSLSVKASVVQRTSRNVCESLARLVDCRYPVEVGARPLEWVDQIADLLGLDPRSLSLTV